MRGTAIGSYTVLDKLGEGGMGTVWVAEHTLLGRRAAIKLLHSTFSTNELIVQRFFDEAKAIVAIGDPGIVQIFDFGVHADGAPFIVMELLEGEPLDARLRRVGRLSVGDAVRLVKQVAISLSAAHGKGVIHRDLKPENLYVVKDPAVAGGERVKVLDFGIAKLSGGDGKYKTRTGAVIGTPAYMSPEQCRAIGNIDHRADIYSLGAVLFCLVTGRPPFEGEGAGDAIISHVRDQPPVPSALAPGVPIRLDSVILRCLEKEPARRYQAMEELAGALEGIEPGPRERAASSGIEVPPARPGTQGPPEAVTPVTTGVSSLITTISDAPGEVAPGGLAARRRWLGLAVGAGAAIGIALAIAFSGGSDDKAPAPAAGSAVPAAAPAADRSAEEGSTKEVPKPAIEEPAAAPAPAPTAAPAPAPTAAPAPAPTAAAPADEGISIDAGLVASPDRPAPQRPNTTPKPRDRRDNPRHEPKAGSGHMGRIDRGD